MNATDGSKRIKQKRKRERNKKGGGAANEVALFLNSALNGRGLNCKRRVDADINYAVNSKVRLV
jgi:hypothetical protein